MGRATKLINQMFANVGTTLSANLGHPLSSTTGQLVVGQSSSSIGNLTTTQGHSIGSSLNPNGSTFTIPQTGIWQVSSGSTLFTPPLTDAESKELMVLEEQHRIQVKQAKLNTFKALPNVYRQHIVNILTWSDAVDEINGIDTVPVDSRLNELRMKNSNQINWAGINVHGRFNAHLPIPEGLSVEDLVNAHLEASIEEELTNEETKE